MSKVGDLACKYRVVEGKKFHLSQIDPGDTGGLKAKEAAQAELVKGIQHLSELQEKLYAQDRWSLLLIFQAMDAAGKDSTIEHVMSGVNPQGCEVCSFKQPSAEELDHDFLWRCAKRVPERGRIGIFNRSYYEEVLVVRVHPEFLAGQRIPPDLVGDDLWEQRFDDINAFEQHLTRNGTVIRKFFLYVSPEEQRERFLARLEEPEKNWKFSPSDVAERQHWGAYMAAYEDMIRKTSTQHAPWFVVPADHKWFTRLVVSKVIVETLQELNPQFPELTADQRRQFEEAKATLLQEKAKIRKRKH